MFLYRKIKDNAPKENKKKVIFSESFIEEALTDIVYHYTSLRFCYRIMESDTIYLQSALGGQSDNYGNGKMFYLSTTRQRSNVSGYKKDTTGVARLELDGRRLNQRYSGKPIDYWGKDFRTPERFETEDRLLSNESEIYPASKYIKRIDILINPDKEYDVQLATNILYSKSFLRRITYVYDNANDFNKQSDNTLNKELLDFEKFDQSQKIDKSVFDHNKNALIDAAKYFGYLYSNMLPENLYKNRKQEYAKLLNKNGLNHLAKNSNIYNNLDGVMGGIKEAINYMSDNLHNLSRNPTEESQKFIKLVSVFFKNNNLKSYRDLYKAILKNGGGRDYERQQIFDIDKNKKIKVLTVIGLDNYPKIYITNPDKESFWAIFPEREKFINDLYRTLDNNHYREGYGEMDKLWKYLQHLAKNNISCTQMLTILRKFGLTDEEMNDVLNEYKFQYQELGFFDLLYDYHTPEYFKSASKNRYDDEYNKLLDIFRIEK